MIRNIKVLGLAIVAVLAMSAVGSSAAQAAVGELHAGVAPSVLTGQTIKQHQLSVNGFPMKCTNVTFEGKATSTTFTEATVTPTLSGCLYGLPAIVRMNGCKFTFTGGESAQTFQLDIVGCTAGQQITLSVPGCTTTFKEQGPLSHVVFTNSGPPGKDVVANVTIKGIHAVENGAECPVGGTTTTGQFSGETTVQAFANPVEVQVTKHGHQYIEYTHAVAATTLFAT